jgi:hypothetical protein
LGWKYSAGAHRALENGFDISVRVGHVSTLIEGVRRNVGEAGLGRCSASAAIGQVGCCIHGGVQAAFWIRIHSTTAANSAAGSLICRIATGWGRPLINSDNHQPGKQHSTG